MKITTSFWGAAKYPTGDASGKSISFVHIRLLANILGFEEKITAALRTVLVHLHLYICDSVCYMGITGGGDDKRPLNNNDSTICDLIILLLLLACFHQG
jgi:hypothetical protein